jgi:hypothetical protein
MVEGHCQWTTKRNEYRRKRRHESFLKQGKERSTKRSLFKRACAAEGSCLRHRARGRQR